MTTLMNHLTSLLERLQQAEIAYKTAKTSLDNSLEYIVCKEELKNARFIWNKACSDYVMSVLEEDGIALADPNNIREQYNLEEN